MPPSPRYYADSDEVGGDDADNDGTGDAAAPTGLADRAIGVGAAASGTELDDGQGPGKSPAGEPAGGGTVAVTSGVGPGIENRA